MKWLFPLTETLVVASYLENRDWLQVTIDQTEIIPAHFDILEGTPVRSYCGSFSPVDWTYSRNANVDDINVSFTYDPLPSDSRFENNSIILTNLSVADSGYFHCTGTFRDYDTRMKYFKNWFSVKVWGNTPVGFVLPSVIEISEGEKVTLSCGSTRQVEWFGLTLADQQIRATNNTLTLWNLSKENSGTYICRGTLSSREIFHSRCAILVDFQVIFGPFP